MLGEEIVALTLIDLYIADGHLYFFLFQSFLIKYIRQSPGNQPPIIKTLSPTRHGKRLTRTSLSIGKNGPIVAINRGVNDILGHLVKNLFLLGLHVEKLVEGENALLLLVVYVAFLGVLWGEELDLVLLAVDLEALIDLFGGADSEDDVNGLVFAH